MHELVGSQGNLYWTNELYASIKFLEPIPLQLCASFRWLVDLHEQNVEYAFIYKYQ